MFVLLFFILFHSFSTSAFPQGTLKAYTSCYLSHPYPQVDIMQMCVVEMTDRPGKPVFHLEHYIEGKYIKYNSNSGFVRDDNIRLTPQVSDVTCWY